MPLRLAGERELNCCGGVEGVGDAASRREICAILRMGRVGY